LENRKKLKQEIEELDSELKGVKTELAVDPKENLPKTPSEAFDTLKKDPQCSNLNSCE
jgi:hypothetical protein